MVRGANSFHKPVCNSFAQALKLYFNIGPTHVSNVLYRVVPTIHHFLDRLRSLANSCFGHLVKSCFFCCFNLIVSR